MKRKEKLNLLEKTLYETQRAFLELKKEVEELRRLIAKDVEVDAEEVRQAIRLIAKDVEVDAEEVRQALIWEVLPPNRKAYFAPQNSTQILESDPPTKEDIDWDIPQLLFSKDSGLVLATNGKHNKEHFEALVITGNFFRRKNYFSTTWGKEPFTKFKGTLKINQE